MGCDQLDVLRVEGRVISTHTSRVGCDDLWDRLKQKDKQISTHTSRVGCDKYDNIYHWNQNISTHTSRVGCDVRLEITIEGNNKFLLTHPVWDVTLIVCHAVSVRDISTHTSRVGCDPFSVLWHSKIFDFYSHIPCGM